jgi:hypothetical protein
MYSILGACVVMTSALQHIETERWRRGISLLTPASMAMVLACSARLKARLRARLKEGNIGLSMTVSGHILIERTSGKPPILGRLALGLSPGPSRSPLSKASPIAPSVPLSFTALVRLTRVSRERKAI